MGLFDSIPRPTRTYHSGPYDRISPTKTTFPAAGKTILITGGATGVGFSISKSFAEAGVARIIIVSRSPGPQQEAKNALQESFPKLQIDLVQAAITDDARMIEVLKTAGPVDVLVLCAAMTHPHVDTIKMEEGLMEDVYNTNVFASYNMVKAYLNLPAPSSGTRTIINVSSAALQLYMPRYAGYSTSKAAFTQMMSFMATEHSPETDGVRLMSFHPGAFLTPMAKGAGYTEDSLPEWEDIRLPGHFAVWASSKEADFLHGRFVWAHWDVDELIAMKEEIKKNPNLLRLGVVM